MTPSTPVYKCFLSYPDPPAPNFISIDRGSLTLLMWLAAGKFSLSIAGRFPSYVTRIKDLLASSDAQFSNSYPMPRATGKD